MSIKMCIYVKATKRKSKYKVEEILYYFNYKNN